MDNFIEAFSNFIGGVIATAIIGGSILLIAGEIRLAALKKAQKGSVRLSTFTERMTKTKLSLQN